MRPTVSAHMSRFAAREGPLSCECFDLVSCSNGSAPPRRALVRSDPDESTVMSDADGPRDIHVAIYQTVDADADSDGPGSNRGRAHQQEQRAKITCRTRGHSPHYVGRRAIANSILVYANALWLCLCQA